MSMSETAVRNLTTINHLPGDGQRCERCGFQRSSGTCPGSRPVLIGMNNPYNTDPRYALFAAPTSATGARVFDMLREAAAPRTLLRADYHYRFHRRNVLNETEWNLPRAKLAGLKMQEERLGPMILVFGVRTREAMHLPRWPELHFVERRGRFYAWAPHPSGRNPWYNSQENRDRVGDVLLKMYEGRYAELLP